MDLGRRPSIAVDGINEKLATMLGTEVGNVTINDLAVNPASGQGLPRRSPEARAATAQPVLSLRVDRSGKVEVVSLTDGIPFSKAMLVNGPASTPAPAGGAAPEPAAKKGMGHRPSPRSQAITDHRLR